MKTKHVIIYAIFICLTACQSREEMCDKITSSMQKEELFIKVLSKEHSGRVSDIVIEDLSYENTKYSKHFEQFFYVKIFKLCEIGDTIYKEKHDLKYCIKKKSKNIFVSYTCDNDASENDVECKFVYK